MILQTYVLGDPVAVEAKRTAIQAIELINQFKSIGIKAAFIEDSEFRGLGVLTVMVLDYRDLPLVLLTLVKY